MRLPYVIADLLSDPANTQLPCYLEPVPNDISDTFSADYIIGPINTGRWFKRTADDVKATRGSSTYTLAIKIFADSTVADTTRSKYKYKPVVVTIENLPQSAINKVRKNRTKL